jgi:hypothetical protein
MFHRFQTGFYNLPVGFIKSYILLFGVVFHSTIERVRYVDVRAHLCPKDI